MLDLVITHYDEPWEIGKRLFDTIASQIGIDFEDIHVVLVHDGSERFPCENFSGYPFPVQQVCIPHGGVSAARNAGMTFCERKWVQFVDFDDCFSNVFALKNVLDVIDTNDFDLLWGEFWAVDRTKDGKTIITKRGENVVFVHAKYFRRKWLESSGLKFDTELEFNEDCLFVTIAMESIPPERQGKITTDFPVFTWCYTPDSATSTESHWWRAFIGGYKRNKKVCEFIKEHSPERYDATFSRLVWDAYHAFNLVNVPDTLTDVIDDFRELYKANKEHFWFCDPVQMQEVMKISVLQYTTGEQESLRRWGTNPMKRREDVSIKEWLNGLETGVF